MWTVTDSNYYHSETNKFYFSVSQFKDFMKCEAAAMAKIKGEYETPMTRALLVGSFVDSYFEGTLSDFMKKHPEVFTRRNELRSEFKKANQIIEKVQNDKLFMQFMSGEKQKIITFEMFGVPWKMKMDSYIKGVCITDLKVVANFRTLPLWRYDIQGAIYQYGVRNTTGENLPFYLAAVTKENAIDMDIFQIPQSTLDRAMNEIAEKIERFVQIKKGFVSPTYCGKCDYCKNIKSARIRNYNELFDI